MTKPVTIDSAEGVTANFNYASVPADVRDQMRTDASAIRSSLISASISFMEVGERLARWRNELPHGAWLPWVQIEIGMSEQSARDAINVFLRFRDNPLFLKEEGLALPQTALVRLAKAPEAAFEDVKGYLVRGERLRVSDVTAIVKRHRETEKEKDEEVVLPEEPKAQVSSGPESLRAMAEKSRNELVSQVLARLDAVLKVIEEAEVGKLRRGALEKTLRPEAQWLVDALEQLTQRRASSSTRLVHSTFLARPSHDPGPWADVAAFLQDIAASSAWEAIKAADIPHLLQRGRSALQTVLPPDERAVLHTK